MSVRPPPSPSRSPPLSIEPLSVETPIDDGAAREREPAAAAACVSAETAEGARAVALEDAACFGVDVGAAADADTGAALLFPNAESVRAPPSAALTACSSAAHVSMNCLRSTQSSSCASEMACGSLTCRYCRCTSSRHMNFDGATTCSRQKETAEAEAARRELVRRADKS
eukprot:3362247-Pleurochrysis_carterae.AAC.3